MTNPVIDILRAKSLKIAPEGEFFTLSSGAKSRVYMDVRRSALSPEGHHVLGNYLLMRIISAFSGAVAVAGVELGGCPLASAVSMTSAYSHHSNLGDTDLIRTEPLEALYVRKRAKEHGTGNLVEGNFVPGMKVVLVEDVVTSGGSSIRAVRSLRETGADVLGVIAVLDREEGASSAFESEGIKFERLTTMREVLAE